MNKKFETLVNAFLLLSVCIWLFIGMYICYIEQNEIAMYLSILLPAFLTLIFMKLTHKFKIFGGSIVLLEGLFLLFIFIKYLNTLEAVIMILLFCSPMLLFGSTYVSVNIRFPLITRRIYNFPRNI